MLWRILLAICAITFIVAGTDLASRANGECRYVAVNHAGRSFLYDCASEQEDFDELAGGTRMSGVTATWLAFGLAALGLFLASLPWSVIPFLIPLALLRRARTRNDPN